MKIVIAGLFMLVVAGWAGAGFACENCGCQLVKADISHKHVVAGETPVASVNAGNKFCPVMGSPVSPDSPNKVEYKGKIYNLCCGGCKEAFLKDPKAALKKLAALEAAAKK